MIHMYAQFPPLNKTLIDLLNWLLYP